jgi:hypothetical protein
MTSNPFTAFAVGILCLIFAMLAMLWAFKKAKDCHDTLPWLISFLLDGEPRVDM